MNQTIKEKWITALRSGEYKQGKDVLRSGDEFCCLGVLCDLICPHGWSERESSTYVEGTMKPCTEHLLTQKVLPHGSILGVSGLYRSDARELADMNDCGVSFIRIAKYIEENL